MKRKVVFISYANEAMAYSLKRIGRQARRLKLFDDVLLYTPGQVPPYVRQSPLFSYPRGAGYWCWKPALIFETLQKYEEGTIVVYVDAGCTLRKSPMWEELFSYMENYDSICFQYAESQPQWEKWGSASSKMKYWTKKNTLDFLQKLTSNPGLGDCCQTPGTILLMKGRDNTLLKKWKDFIFAYPELIMDPTQEEKADQYPGFAGHRHDQAVLTAFSLQDPGTIILPEISEQYRKDSFVWFSRIRAKTWRDYIVIQAKHYLRLALGDVSFERMKNLFSS